MINSKLKMDLEKTLDALRPNLVLYQQIYTDTDINEHPGLYHMNNIVHAMKNIVDLMTEIEILKSLMLQNTPYDLSPDMVPPENNE